MAKVVICPSCQSKGSVPDGAQAARIRCPNCGQTFDVKAASQSSPGTAKRPAPGAGPRRPAAAQNAAFGDLESVQPLAPIGKPGVRRPPGAASAKHSGPSPVLFALLGVGGVALLAIVVLVVVFTRPGPAPAGGGGGQVLVDASSPSPVQPVATTAVATTSFVNSSSSSGNSAIDSAEVVRRLKDATVYIKNKVAGKALASGTGFVIEVIGGDTVIVATNRHVAVFDLSEVPERYAPKGSVAELEVVFRSGQGPQNEQALPAQIIAADTTDDLSTDLAFLLVKGVKRPPTPINPLAKVEPTEGMTYKAGGFPFGGALAKVSEASSKGNPSVSITGGSIAALRRDDYGQILLLQVDGSLQPGNSGGPIVDEKTGKLLGVAVAKNAMVDTIGLIVPADEVRRALGGRVGDLDLTVQAIQQTSADLDIKAQIVDPKGKVQGVVVHAAPASAGTVSPGGDGKWPPLPNTTGVELQRDPKLAMASGRIQVALSGQGAAARKVLIQTAHRDLQGTLVYSKPREIDLPEKPGPIMISSKIMKILKALERKSLSMLGKLVDPEKDCKLTKDEANMKVKIDIPGGKVRTLAPFVHTRLNRKKPLHNAPMVLIDVEGDFAAMVEVTGEWSPGAKLPKDRQGNDIPFTFNGAGLLLYQDKDNFVRLERTAGVDVNDLHPIHKVLFEVVKDGKQVENQNYPPVPEGTVYLILVRRKGRVTCGYSQNLTSPPRAAQAPVELDLPAKVKIGLSAGNISAKPFAATFENFAVINNETQLEAMLGDSETPQEKKAP
ncbi:MAG: trypsin-like peptidase domain-containing protein [Isosphaerales bacterium]